MSDPSPVKITNHIQANEVNGNSPLPELSSSKVNGDSRQKEEPKKNQDEHREKQMYRPKLIINGEEVIVDVSMLMLKIEAVFKSKTTPSPEMIQELDLTMFKTLPYIMEDIAPLLGQKTAIKMVAHLFSRLSGNCKDIRVLLTWVETITNHYESAFLKESWFLERVGDFFDNSDSRIENLTMLNKLSTRLDLIFSQRKIQNNVQQLEFAQASHLKQDLTIEQSNDPNPASSDNEGLENEGFEFEKGLNWKETDFLPEISEGSDADSQEGEDEAAKRAREEKDDSSDSEQDEDNNRSAKRVQIEKDDSSDTE